MVNEEALVSVIVPVYNAEKYVARCIDSILAQTYKNIEVIMIDDGSTDGSADICREYVDKDSRCRYFFQENAGPDYARKSGVANAEGSFLAFLDSDDYAKPEMIEEMLGMLFDNDCDIVTSYFTRFNDSGKVWTTDAIPEKCFVCDDVSEMMMHYFVTRYLAGTYVGKIYKAELLKDYPFVKNGLIGEDITGVLHALRSSKRVYVTNKSYYMYYWNTNSISHAKYSERHLVSLRNYIKLRDELVSNNYIDDVPIIGYFAEFEMAVSTAMARANIIDETAVNLLREDLKPRWKKIKACKGTPAYMKVCIKFYLLMPRLFIRLYRVLYLMTGR